MDVLAMIYTVQRKRLAVFRHRAEWQFKGDEIRLYKEALAAERLFWCRFLDWYEMWDKCDPCADVSNTAADAQAAWHLLMLKISEPKEESWDRRVAWRIREINDEKAWREEDALKENADAK